MKKFIKILFIISLICAFIYLLYIWSSKAPLYGYEDKPPVEDILARSQMSYEDEDIKSFYEILRHRVIVEPFNLVSTIIFFLAIIHIMMTGFFHHKAIEKEREYEKLKSEGLKPQNSRSMIASILHLFSEVEAVFGLWAIVLAIATLFYHNWESFIYYLNSLDYTEPLFKVVVMTIASTRAIIKLFEMALWKIVKFIGNTIETWWICILIITPILGSFITEPAAMTIGALLLADKFYLLNPSKRLKYATLSLLFVNVSLGGAITNFTGMSILLVSGVWKWNLGYILTTFSWKILLAIVISTFSYYLFLREDLSQLKEPFEHQRFKRHIQHRFISHKEMERSFIDLAKIVDKRVSFSSELNAYSFILKENIKELAHAKLTSDEHEMYDIDNAIDEKFEGIKLEEMQKLMPGLLEENKRPRIIDPNWDQRSDLVPKWVITIHALFLIWSVVNAHEPVLLIAGLLFFLGFYQVTGFYQNRLDFKPALLVAFFLSGLMIHGTLQAWWIGPLLGSLNTTGLNIASILLSSFNDNASIAYLGTLVSDMNPSLKYALFTGAITGGGLTIIANAPNAVGRSILKSYFPDNISSVKLFCYALPPTVISAIIFGIFRVI